MTLPSTWNRPGVHCRFPRRTERPQQATLPLFPRAAAFREACLHPLQGIAELLEVNSRSFGMPRYFGRRASCFASGQRSSWRRPPVPSSSRGASGVELQFLQRLAELPEARLQRLRDCLQVLKNRLQRLRLHLQELEAPPSAACIAGAAFPQNHETSPLGFR